MKRMLFIMLGTALASLAPMARPTAAEDVPVRMAIWTDVDQPLAANSTDKVAATEVAYRPYRRYYRPYYGWYGYRPYYAYRPYVYPRYWGYYYGPPRYYYYRDYYRPYRYGYYPYYYWR